MLLTDTGLRLSAFDPVLAAALGSARGEEGGHVLIEATARKRTAVDVRDWLYCLAKTPGSWVRKRLIDAVGQSAEDFVSGIEGGFPPEPSHSGPPPVRLSLACVTPGVRGMLDRAEDITRETGRSQVVDAVLTSALLGAADPRLRELLIAWTSEQGFQAFDRLLREEIRRSDAVPDLFDANGQMRRSLFTSGGRRFCDRLLEDATSLGATRIGSRHLLYTLLGIDRGLLARTLTAFGVDVKHQLHSALCRELVRRDQKRTEHLLLTRETLFDTVVTLFEHAERLARVRGGDGVAEHDLSRAFAAKQRPELERVLAGLRGVATSTLVDHLEASEFDEEDEEGNDDRRHRIALTDLEQQINARIRGQSAATARVMPWIKRLRFGLPRDGRPAAVFLFLGPTGTGKTQMAKELARHVFGDEGQLLFLEMGQFKTKESMSMFIGAPPGYVGYGDGKLTNGLRDKPESVVLFDEIEKADTQVFDTLLRFADEGIISDPAGPVRDGRKCIIVMTTNAGQTWLRSHLREQPAGAAVDGLTERLFAAAMQELIDRGFRPEFLGRVDERITFLPLTRETCRQIVDQVLERELDKFKRLKDVEIDISSEARDVLAARAHARSLEEGARGVPRAINEQLVTPAIDLLIRTEADGTATDVRRLIATAVGLDGVKLEALK